MWQRVERRLHDLDNEPQPPRRAPTPLSRRLPDARIVVVQGGAVRLACLFYRGETLQFRVCPEPKKPVHSGMSYPLITVS